MSFDKVFDELFKESYPTFNSFGCDFFSKASYPKVNVLDNNGDITILAAVPGLKKEDISVEFDQEESALSISADSVRKVDKTSSPKEGENVETEIDEPSYLIRELKQSSFKRTFLINNPGNYDFQRIDAKMEDGILTIIIPKTEESKKEKIEICISS